jgi:hypothetical protein
MEEHLSMPELIAILTAKQEEDYQNKKFFAALKGVDLDNSAGAGKEKWEEIAKIILNGDVALNACLFNQRTKAETCRKVGNQDLV